MSDEITNKTTAEILSWGVPGIIILSVICIFGILQVIGEVTEAFGKTVPTVLKIRKYFIKRKTAKQEKLARELAIKEALENIQIKESEFNRVLAEVKIQNEDVKQLLTEVNLHYSSDNIKQRNKWMRKVDESMDYVYDRAAAYDSSIETINQSLNQVSQALKESALMTEEMFVQNHRDRIIDFAEKVSDPDYIASKEQFERIFNLYKEYNEFLHSRNRKNGQIDANYDIILDAYKYRIKHRSFAEDLNRYKDIDNE